MPYAQHKLTALLVILLIRCHGDDFINKTVREDRPGSADNYREYCQFETFQPSCMKNEVIVIESAIYGRMRFGRCLENDDAFQVIGQNNPQNFGCYEDVLPMVNTKCSGKSDCEIRISDPEMKKTSPCYKTLFMYLEASYVCVSVIQQDRSCTVYVSDSPLHFSSSFHSQSGCGTKTQPWILEAQLGQQINVTLLDFTRGPTADKTAAMERIADASSNSQFVGDAACKSYGYVEEKIAKKTAQLCRERNRREKSIFLSEGNEIHVILNEPKVNVGSSFNFLIRFQATGCFDLIPPPEAWLKRTGNEAIIGCYSTRQTWHLQCKGRQWFGVMGNCTQQSVADHHSLETKEPKNQEMGNALTIVFVSCALILLCLIIVVCFGILITRRCFQGKPSKDLIVSDGITRGPFIPVTSGQQMVNTGHADPYSVYAGSDNNDKRKEIFNGRVTTMDRNGVQYFVLDQDIIAREQHPINLA